MSMCGNGKTMKEFASDGINKAGIWCGYISDETFIPFKDACHYIKPKTLIPKWGDKARPKDSLKEP